MKTKRLIEEQKKIGTWGNLNPNRLDIILKYAGKKILDAGCSSGAYVRYLLRKEYNAYGFDLLLSKNWEGEYRNRFKSGDLCQTPYSDKEFDTVTAFEVLEHIKDIDTAFREIIRITRKNIIMSVPDSELYPLFKESGMTFHHWVDRTHLQFFTEKSLRKKLLEHGLFIQFLGRINDIYPEMIFIDTLRAPCTLKKILIKAARKLPIAKRYRMTLIAVASKSRP